jgi:hypothetical protein
MAHTFSYAIIKAVPDPRRGERVNVGIIVFLSERVDARFSDLAKLSALRSGNWDQYATEARDRIVASYRANEKPAAFIERFSLLEDVLGFSDVAWFSVDRAEQYEDRIKDILAALVLRPKPEPKSKSTRINTEIAKTFRSVGILAKSDESIDDNKVVRDFYVSQEDDLKADFAVKNGVYRVVATLDLRGSQVGKSQAAIKAITLDRAREAFGATAKRLAVYAAPPGTPQYRPHIHMLGEYSDDLYNWLDPGERRAYMRAIYDALSGPSKFDFKPV